MRKNFSRILAGVLSAALVFSSGSYTAFAGAEGASVSTDTPGSEVVTGPDTEPGEETGNGGLPSMDEPESADEGISELGGGVYGRKPGGTACRRRWRKCGNRRRW